MTLDDETVALRLLADRRRELVRTRTQTLNRTHQLLMELIPSGAPKRLSATKAKQLVATVKPRDIAGRTRRAMVVELIDDVVILDRKIKAVTKQIRDAVAVSGTTLIDIVGIGPVLAAIILGEVGDVSPLPGAGITSPASPAPRRSRRPVARSSGTGSTGSATVSSTTRCTPQPSSSSRMMSAAAPTTNGRRPSAKAASARCAASNDDCPTPSIARWLPTAH